MRIKIIIIGEDDFFMNTPHFVINCDYGRSVAKAGGTPILALDPLHPEEYVSLGDGLLLTGGPDIHCGRYGEFYRDPSDVPYLTRSRDIFELKMCELFMDANKPIFGIGRGMQILNVALGGTM